MQFSQLVTCFEKLETTSSLNEMTTILAALFLKADPAEIDTIAYFVLGRTGPEYSAVQLGMGENLVRASIALASGVDEHELERMKEVGDLGDLAMKAGGAVRQMSGDLFPIRTSLTVADVRRGFAAIAAAGGSGSQEKKIRILAAMIAASSVSERRYLVRLATGQMRLGVGDMTILDALAEAYLGSKRKRAVLEQAYNVSSDIGYVAKALRTGGIDDVQNTGIALNRPIRPMLAQRVGKLAEVLERMPGTDVAAEEKYDGERIQAHKDGDSIRLFSRRLTDITAQFPDVVTGVRDHVRVHQAILDGEAVAFDPIRRTYFPFQELMHRRRKYRVGEYAESLPVRYMVFDLLWKDGVSLLGAGYPQRRAALESMVHHDPGIGVTERVVTRDLASIQGFFDDCIHRGLEGIVCKSCAPHSVYRAGSRDWQWIKWKTSYGTKVRDTFDLVIVGAYAGRGVRSGLYGSVLCAAYDPHRDLYQTVCRMGTGFSDEELKGLPARLADASIREPPIRVMIAKQVAPHFYFAPRYVIEVLAHEITKSPVHTCGWDPVEKRGFSLRFPRFVRWRADKAPDQTTTVAEIIDFYRMQGAGQ